MTSNKLTLLIMRHGAYERDTMSLSTRGELDVVQSTKELIAEGIIPDLILYSPIKRTVETAVIVKDVFQNLANNNVHSMENEQLSIKTRKSQLDAILREKFLNKDDSVKTLLLVTHQPNAAFLTYCINQVPASLRTAEVRKHIFTADKWAEAL